MSILQSYLAQIVMGSTMVAIGFHDFRRGKESEGVLRSLDKTLFPGLSDEILMPARRASSVLLMVVGFGICLAGFFTQYWV